MKKLSTLLGITQVKKEKTEFGPEVTVKRFNPYNPLSYIVIVLLVLVGIVFYGPIGFWEAVDLKVLSFHWKKMRSTY